MISSFAKVVGLQSRLLKTRFFIDIDNMILDTENTFSMTAVIILVIMLIIFNFGNIKLTLAANKLFFYGLPISKANAVDVMGKP